jgi:hypothetical protein
MASHGRFTRRAAAATADPMPPVYPCERILVERATSGQILDASDADPRRNSVVRGPAWSTHRTIRAEFLAHVLSRGGDLSRVWIRGARITGYLDLEGTHVKCPILLERCRIESTVDLRDARAVAIRLQACSLSNFLGDRAQVDELSFDESQIDLASLVATKVSGELSLRYARVEGGDWPVEPADERLHPADRPQRHVPPTRFMAINAERVVAEAVVCDGLWATGEVRLVGARVGKATFSGAELTAHEGGLALAADGIHVEEDMLFWRDEVRKGALFKSVGQIRMTGARLRTLSMSGADIKSTDPARPALVADGMTAAVSIHLDKDFRASGAIVLSGAETRVLSLASAHLSAREGTALEADRLVARSGVFLQHAEIDGAVSLADAHIYGELNLEHTKLNSEAGPPAFGGDRLRADALFGRECRIDGTVLLRGAHITGVVNLDEAKIRTVGRPAMRADQLFAGSGMSWRGCEIDGEVRMPGARVTGRFRLEHAKLRNPGEVALEATELTVDQQLLCDHVQFEGSVLLRGAEASMASFKNAVIREPGTEDLVALDGDGLVIRHDLFLENLQTDGTVRFSGAHLVVLSLAGARLEAAGDKTEALVAEGIRVDRAIFARNLVALGTVMMADAVVTGQVKLDGAVLRDNPRARPPNGLALDLEGARVGILSLRLGEEPRSYVDLRSAIVGHLDIRPIDGSLRWWPRCRLSDCRYERLRAPTGQRLAWVSDDPDDFSPQPYEQLATLYRSEGRDADARLASIARHRRRRRTLPWGRRTWPTKIWGLFLDLAVGYGYRPWQAGLWLIVLVTMSTVVFDNLCDVNHKGETKTADYDINPARDVAEVPPFEPLIYSVDLVIPVISLGQRIAWNPSGGAQWVAFALTIFGWLLTTALIAGVASRRQ